MSLHSTVVHDPGCEMFQMLFENVPDPVLIASDDRVYVEANSAASRFYGIPREQLLGMRIDDFVCGDVDVDAAWQRFLSSGAMSGEIKLRGAGGQILDVDFRARAGFAPGLHLSLLRDITEQKSTLVQLNNATERLTTVLNSTTDCVFALNIKGDFIYLNERAAQRIAKGRDLHGANIWEVFPDAVGHTFFVECNAALTTQTPAHFETEYAGLGGIFEVHLFPSRDGLSVFFRDITERKRLEAELANERERIDLVLRACNDGIWDVDLRTDEAAFSVRWREMLGLLETEVPRTLSKGRELVHPEDLPAVLEKFDAHCRQLTPCYSAEFRMRDAGGNYRWVLSRGQAIWGNDGQAVRMIGSHTDITSHRAAAEQVQRQAAILSQIQDSIISTDVAGNVTQWNKGSARIFDYAEDEVLGTNVSRLFADPGELHRRLEAARAGMDVSFEAEVLRKSGETRFVSLTLSILRNSAGERVGYILCSQDVTDRRKAEHALRIAEERLKAAQRAANIGMWQEDCRTGETVGSEELFRIYGRPSVEGISYDKWLAWVHPEDRQRAAEQVSLVRNGDSGTLCELKILRPDGAICWTSGTVNLVRNDDGTPDALVGFVTDITHRKITEEQLKASERHFRSLIENALDIITVLDATGAVRYQSPSLKRTLGYQPDELTGRCAFEFVHPDDVAHVLRTFELGVGAPRSIHRLEYRFRHKDGSWRVLQSVATNVLDDPSVRGIVVNSRDVTEGWHAEERLRESERRLSLAQSAANIGTWDWDISADCWNCSDDCLRIHRLYHDSDESESGGSHRWHLLNVPPHPALGEFARKLARATVNVSECEYEVRSSDDDIRWISTKGTLICDENGAPVRMLGVSADVTERKRHQDGIARSEQNLAEAQALAKMGNFEWDVRTGKLQGSAEVYRIAGISPGKAVSLDDIERLVHAEDRDMLTSVLREALESRQPFAVDHRIVTPEGSTRFVTLRGTVVSGDRGLTRLTAIVQDVTERTEMEQQLRHAQKMEAVGRLAGGIAHDFNNLLTVVLGYTNLVYRKVGEDSPLRPRIVEISKAAERAASLTQQLLAFSRKQVLQRKSVNLNDVVSATELMLRRLLGENITLTLHLASNLEPITADPSRMDQVIMNLAVNARDAMPETGELIVETANVLVEPNEAEARSLAAGSYVLLRVTDTGTGMDAFTQSRIFEPFFTTKPQGKGTGLGLSTVQGIVDQTGGNMSVTSEIGKGTTFRIYFPREHADA